MTSCRVLARFALFCAVVLAAGGIARAAPAPLPDPHLTPGAINPDVSQADIGRTICVRGWTATVRPPVSYTEPLKKRQIRAYGYRDRRPWHYEEDHLIPLDLGGAPSDPRNLWPEPHLGPHQWGSYAKDRLEVRLVRLVCRHRLSLNKARAMIAHDWTRAYRRFIDDRPDNTPRHDDHDHGWHQSWHHHYWHHEYGHDEHWHHRW